MAATSENKPKQYISVGILAHVDAGKTTLSEGILYLTGQIRKLGRVDHGDAFLDMYTLERSRGITIFSKQANFVLGDKQVTLLDTPGHVDFSAEMERTLQVLDYAILVVSGADGVQGHTRTLWNLLARYQVPTFIFINKMDQDGTNRQDRLAELKRKLSGECVDFTEAGEEFLEELSMCDETVMESYLENGKITTGQIQTLIRERKVFPCYFGSALKLEGVQELLDGLEKYMDGPVSGTHAEEAFGAKVYKISRDSQGSRLTHMKITNGVLKVKEILEYMAEEELLQEKVNQIRIYSGDKYEMVQEAEKGCICAVTGLTRTYPGQGLGMQQSSSAPILEPVLNYRVELPEGCDVHRMLQNFRQLEEEDPMLRVVWNEEAGEIQVQLMGEVQTEILQSLVKERFDVDISFGSGNIVYKETIKNIVEGVGHFEPLRHYAEVHLILEPGEPGSGITIDTICSEDVLDKNWQRLILTHVLEREHRGVLTGSVLTDVKITLASGRAHLKHTEGGDFRQAVYRAIRQGLMQAENVLLEPYYAFRLEIPSEMTGRALTDIQRMNGEFDGPETEDDMAVVTGSAPVSEMQDYQREVTTYSRGRGKLFCTLKGYFPCHNQDEVVEAIGYDPERDVENPIMAIENLSATTLRNIIGDMELDETLTSRETINTKMRASLDEATDPWGIKVNRVELKNIIPPAAIQDAMEKQMKAERERREAILIAEGQKKSTILVAEGKKQSAILDAEAEKQAAILRAEAQKERMIKEAEGQAEAVLKVQNANAEGIRMIREAGADEAVLTLKSLEAFARAADGKATKIIIPSDIQGIAGLASSLKEIVTDPKAETDK